MIGLSDYQFQAIITNNGTHTPETWAEYLLKEIVPTPDDATPTTLMKIANAKEKLLPHVVAMIKEVRDTEVRILNKLKADEQDAVVIAYHTYNGGKPHHERLYFHLLHKEIGKLRASTDWAEQYVRAICKVCDELEGNIGRSNYMMDQMYRILDRWLNSVQLLERSHFVSDNNLNLSK